MASNEPPRIVLSTSYVVAGTWRDLYIEAWRTPGRAEDVRASYGAQNAFSRSIGGKIAVISVVSKVTSVDNAVRVEISEGVKNTYPLMKAGALVVTATGFAMAVMRGILTGINLVQRMEFPSTVVANVSGGCAFVLPYLAEAATRPTAAQLEAVYETVVAAPIA